VVSTGYKRHRAKKKDVRNMRPASFTFIESLQILYYFKIVLNLLFECVPSSSSPAIRGRFVFRRAGVTMSVLFAMMDKEKYRGQYHYESDEMDFYCPEQALACCYGA